VRLMRRIGAAIEVFIRCGHEVYWELSRGGVNVCECFECRCSLQSEDSTINDKFVKSWKMKVSRRPSGRSGWTRNSGERLSIVRYPPGFLHLPTFRKLTNWKELEIVRSNICENEITQQPQLISLGRFHNTESADW
jgi:hypothetical protein